jgi:hypothetical protein
MTKHRTITGFVAVALLAAAATAASMRPHASSTGGMMTLKELTVDVNKLSTEDLDDQSMVYSKTR